MIERAEKHDEYKRLWIQSRTVAASKDLKFLDRLAFIAYMKYQRGWSRKNAKKEWAKQDQCPDVITNNKMGDLKEIAVMGFKTITLTDAKTIQNQYGKLSNVTGDEAWAKLNAAIEATESDSYYRDLHQDALLEGGAVNVGKRALEYEDNSDDDDAGVVQTIKPASSGL